MLNCALEAANAGAAELISRFGGPLDVKSKSSAEDLVSNADLVAEATVRSVINRLRAGDEITGEELQPQFHQNAKVRWSIDPLDGTVNYTRGLPFYCTSVGAASTISGEWLVGAIVAPTLGCTYFAKRGGGAFCVRGGLTKQIFGPPVDRKTKILATGFSYQAENRTIQVEYLAEQISKFVDIRRMGSAALDICACAEGTIDSYYERHIKEHDWAAAMVIAEEAGQRVHRPISDGDAATVNFDV